MLPAPRSPQLHRRRRCNECKRRKKKCEGNGPRCQYCLKKGKTCDFDSVCIVQYIGAKKRSKKKVSTPSFKPLPQAFQFKKKSIEQLLDDLFGTGIPIIYLPRQKTLSQATDTPTILCDEIETIRIFNDEDRLAEQFSLFDFIWSSTRVKFVEIDDCGTNQGELVGVLKKNGTFLGIDESKAVLTKIGPQPNSVTVPAGSSQLQANCLTPPFKSLNEVEFKIDLNNLQKVLFVKEAAVATETDENGSKRFINLPDSMTKEFADHLFRYFCRICQDQETATKLKEKPNEIKVGFLKICLPLIFGNITCLKCVLLLSYYHMLKLDSSSTNLYLKEMENNMRDIHFGVIHELQERLNFVSSICCDHALLCVLLLITIEVVNGSSGPLWSRLLKLCQNMISFRGGVESICSEVTGLCLMRLMSIHFSVGMSFTGEENEYGDPLSLKDFFYVLDTQEQLDFFDNYNYSSRLGLNDIKQVVRVFGHITQLHNLAGISYAANDKSLSMSLQGKYDSISVPNLEHVLTECEILEKTIIKLMADQDDNKKLSYQYKLQSKFAFHTSLLYLYQTVYKSTSISPKTLILVKQLIDEAVELFAALKLEGENSNTIMIFTLPLFLLGVDLMSSDRRTWYREELIHLHNMTRKKPILTLVDLLDQVWQLNEDGSSFVDWKNLSERSFIALNLCC